MRSCVRANTHCVRIRIRTGVQSGALRSRSKLPRASRECACMTPCMGQTQDLDVEVLILRAHSLAKHMTELGRAHHAHQKTGCPRKLPLRAHGFEVSGRAKKKIWGNVINFFGLSSRLWPTWAASMPTLRFTGVAVGSSGACGLPWSGLCASCYPVHAGRRARPLSGHERVISGAPPCLSNTLRFWVFV